MKSGDKNHAESQAAALYFRVLFGSDFARIQENSINAHLNYGYTVLRSAIARTLVQYGFLPVLGLQHHSELNPFNLADDFIEPFRPIVDLLVYESMLSGCLKDDLSSKSKQDLIALLYHQIKLKSRCYTVLAAMDRTIQSFQAALMENSKSLILPEIVPLKEQDYE